MLDPTDFNCLCYALALCHSFKGCALPPSLPFHAHFLSSIPAHNVASTIFWRDNQKIAGLGREISNPLILPSTGHTGDLGDTQLQSGDPRRSTCLDMPRDLVLESLSCLNLFRDPSVQGSQEVNMLRPTQGPNSWEADLPRPAWGFDVQEAVMTQPAWGSTPFPRDAWLSGCNSTG